MGQMIRIGNIYYYYKMSKNANKINGNWSPNTYVDVKYHNSDTILPDPKYLSRSDDNPINVDIGRQLFVDDYLISSGEGYTRTYHQAKYESILPIMNSLLREGKSVTPLMDSIIWDPLQQEFKMWYVADYLFVPHRLCLATSKDGKKWDRYYVDNEVKCEYPCCEECVKRVKSSINDRWNNRTNILGTYGGCQKEKGRGSGSIILDLKEKDENKRYKYFWGANGPIHIYYSSDGIKWNEGSERGGIVLGSPWYASYDPFRDKYLFLMRDNLLHLAKARIQRYIAVDHETDKWKEWGKAMYGYKIWQSGYPSHWCMADKYDTSYTGRKPGVYCAHSVSYESIMLNLISIYQGGDGFTKNASTYLGFSRDGFHQTREMADRKPFLPETRHKKYIMPTGGNIIINHDQIFIYYLYKIDRIMLTGLATIRRDGFVSLDGTFTLTTKCLTTISNKKYLFANFSGKLKVELLDKNGNIIENYHRNNQDWLDNDSCKELIKWNNDIDCLPSLIKEFRIRFIGEKCQLYSFWLAHDKMGCSDGFLGNGSLEHSTYQDTNQSYLSPSNNSSSYDNPLSNNPSYDNPLSNNPSYDDEKDYKMHPIFGYYNTICYDYQDMLGNNKVSEKQKSTGIGMVMLLDDVIYSNRNPGGGGPEYCGRVVMQNALSVYGRYTSICLVKNSKSNGIVTNVKLVYIDSLSSKIYLENNDSVMIQSESRVDDILIDDNMNNLDDIPTDDIAIGDVPIDDIPTDDIAIGDVPTNDIPTDDIAIGDIPTDDIAIGDIPTDDIPTDDIPTDDIAIGSVPTDDIPTDDNIHIPDDNDRFDDTLIDDDNNNIMNDTLVDSNICVKMMFIQSNDNCDYEKSDISDIKNDNMMIDNCATAIENNTVIGSNLSSVTSEKEIDSNGCVIEKKEVMMNGNVIENVKRYVINENVIENVTYNEYINGNEIENVMNEVDVEVIDNVIEGKNSDDIKLSIASGNMIENVNSLDNGCIIMDDVIDEMSGSVNVKSNSENNSLNKLENSDIIVKNLCEIGENNIKNCCKVVVDDKLKSKSNKKGIKKGKKVVIRLKKKV